MATCISCKGEYNEEHPEECPRCGADNRNWHRHKNLSSLARFSDFFFGSVWGLLALVSLVLPLVPALLWDTFNTVAAMRVVVPLASHHRPGRTTMGGFSQRLGASRLFEGEG
jgi:hypothetical protein